MTPETELIVAAVLRRNAHDLRNRISAVISAVDVLRVVTTSRSELFDEALSLLSDGSDDLRDLADTWTEAARELFDNVRDKTCCSQLAEAIGAGAGVEIPITVATENALETRVDLRIVEALSRSIAEAGPARAVEIREETQHGLPFVVAAFDTGEDNATRLAAAETVRAMIGQLGAHSRVEAQTFAIRLPAQRQS